MLEYILNNRHKIAILRLLTQKPRWPFSESEIAKETEIPKSTVFRAIKSLEEDNLIIKTDKGNKVSIIQLNQDNYIINDLLFPLFSKERNGPIERAREFCKSLNKPIIAAIVFGSAARNEMKPTSDIDIAIIADKEFDIENEKDKYLNELNIIISTHFFKPKDFKTRYAKRDPLITEIIKGKTIIGDVYSVIL